MCPSCARLVGRRDKFCDGCNTDLRKSRPKRVQGTKDSPLALMRSAWVVWLLASVLLFLLAHAGALGPGWARAYRWTFIGSLSIASLLVLAAKASEGLVELVYFCIDSRWFFRDDPLDKWVCVIAALALEGLAFMHLIIRPGMPPGCVLVALNCVRRGG